jgi:hypothetical protein
VSVLLAGIDLATVPLRELGRAGRRAQGELGRALARTAGFVPESRMRQVMLSPLRRVVLDALFGAVPGALTGTRAEEVATLARCHVTGRNDGGYDIYWLEYAGGRWRTRRGGAGDAESTDGARRPELTVTVDGIELLRLATGRTNAFASFLSGKLRATGDPAVAARLMALLRGAPARRVAPREPMA